MFARDSQLAGLTALGALHDGETIALWLDDAPLPKKVVATLGKRLAARSLVAAT